MMRVKFCISLIFLSLFLFFPRPAIQAQTSKQCLPKQLQHKKHSDFLLGKFIPRSWTSHCFQEPPKQIFSNQSETAPALNGQLGPLPLPSRGKWQFSLIHVKKHWPFYLPYFAVTTKKGWHMRLGCRWDEVDHYYTFPSFALKKLKPPS